MSELRKKFLWRVEGSIIRDDVCGTMCRHGFLAIFTLTLYVLPIFLDLKQISVVLLFMYTFTSS